MVEITFNSQLSLSQCPKSTIIKPLYTPENFRILCVQMYHFIQLKTFPACSLQQKIQ